MTSQKLFEFDSEQGALIIGTDEAGRGPAAGGVFASAVYFREKSEKIIQELSILNDSKQLSKKKRESIYDLIKAETLNSSLKAMKLACEAVIAELNQQSVLVLVDGNKLIKEFNFPQKFVIKGDSKSASIAAASILAKVTRDRYMDDLDKEYPQYGWAKNAGYLTKAHIEAIDKYGLSPYHRPSFLKKHFAKQGTLF